MIALFRIRPHMRADFRKLGLVRFTGRAGIAEKLDITAQGKGRDAPDRALLVPPGEQGRSKPHRKCFGMNAADPAGPIMPELMNHHDDGNEENEGEYSQKSAADQAHIRVSALLVLHACLSSRVPVGAHAHRWRTHHRMS